jgi:L,D-peptidoglycan transpeptidase YkuD (ErfK/YbiS/YcfS/YnhG family)
MNESVSSKVVVSRLVVSGGRLRSGALEFPVAVGRGGIRQDKREGDGATPAGRFLLRALMFRPDRHATVSTGLPRRSLQRDDGWCDDPSDARYNQLVKLPYHARTEVLWRDDTLYDVIIVIGHNDGPVIPGGGSAIFLHNARSDFAVTDGCVALAPADLLTLAAMVDASTIIEIVGS